MKAKFLIVVLLALIVGRPAIAQHIYVSHPRVYVPCPRGYVPHPHVCVPAPHVYVEPRPLYHQHRYGADPVYANVCPNYYRRHGYIGW